MTLSSEPQSVSDIQDRLLDGLMADKMITGHQHRAYRTLLFPGNKDPRTNYRRRSLASIAECSGRDRDVAPSPIDPYGNRAIQRAAQELEKKTWVERKRLWENGYDDGPGHPYLWRTPDNFTEYREPLCIMARPAIRCLSLQVSPIGPTLERIYCNAWYAMGWWDKEGACGENSFTADQWAEHLRCTRSSVKKYLRDLAEAKMLKWDVLPALLGERAAQIRVRMPLPKWGKAPSGSKSFALFQEGWDEEVELLLGSTPTTTPTEGSEVSQGAYEDAPWADEPEDEDLLPDLEDLLEHETLQAAARAEKQEVPVEQEEPATREAEATPEPAPTPEAKAPAADEAPAKGTATATAAESSQGQEDSGVDRSALLSLFTDAQEQHERTVVRDEKGRLSYTTAGKVDLPHRARPVVLPSTAKAPISVTQGASQLGTETKAQAARDAVQAREAEAANLAALAAIGVVEE